MPTKHQCFPVMRLRGVCSESVSYFNSINNRFSRGTQLPLPIPLTRAVGIVSLPEKSPNASKAAPLRYAPHMHKETLSDLYVLPHKYCQRCADKKIHVHLPGSACPSLITRACPPHTRSHSHTLFCILARQMISSAVFPGHDID